MLTTSAFKLWAGPAALIALAAIACNASGAATSAPAATPTSPPEMTATSTSVPAATAAALPSATTAAEPSATLSLVGGPDFGKVIPIFEGQTGFVLGGSKDRQWLDAEATAAQASGVIRYRVFSGGSQTAEVTRTITTPSPEGGPCAFPAVDMTPDNALPGSIGVAGSWNIAPRVPDSLSLGIPDYLAAIETLLIDHGIAAPEVALSAVSRIDLEGDGTDEVLITAVKLAGMQTDDTFWPYVKAGDYAVVVLRKVVGTEAKTIPFILETYPEAKELAYPWMPTVLGALDLNGDGKLEIVVEQKAFEGYAVEVYEVNGEDVELVLSGGCSL